MKISERILYRIKRILSIRDNKESIARGFALGSFVGMMPIPGFQVLVSVSIASIFKINRKAACMAVFNTNLMTGSFVFAFNFWLGRKILGLKTNFSLPEKVGIGYIKTIIEGGSEVFFSLMLGGAITGLIIAVLSYVLIRKYLNRRNNLKPYDLKTMKNNKFTVITGASRGLGKALAIECAKKGFNLILISLPGEDIYKLATDLEGAYNIEILAREADLTNSSELNSVVNLINDNYIVNMLINNAGTGGSADFQDVSSSYINNILMLNIRAMTLLTHGLLPNLRQNSRAYILNIASMASFGPMPFKTVYPASKAFVYSFSRGLSAELGDSTLCVSVAHPGGMTTNKDTIDRINSYSRLIRSTVLSPEKVANICINRLLRRDSLIIPGFMNKVSYVFFKTCPVWLQLQIFRASIKREIQRKEELCYAG